MPEVVYGRTKSIEELPMEDYDSQLVEIAKGVNSTRSFTERFERVGLSLRQKIRPVSTIRTIRDNHDNLETGRLACGAGYFIKKQGESYVIMAYTQEQFLSMGLENVMLGKTSLPTPYKQWEIPKNKVTPYL